jgi:iron complex transport system substrate-binding protein
LRRPGRARALAALLPLVLAACVPGAAREGAAPVAGPRIVSMNPCTDAILAEVADPAQVVALSAFSRDPASSSMDTGLARRFPAVSGSLEEVIALRPDIVVSGNFHGPATVDAFRRLGIRLVQFPIAGTVAESREQVRQMAALAGRPGRGEALVARIDAALAKAAPPPGTQPVAALVWQSGGIVPGQGTLIADLLHRTGFSSFSASRGLGQADVLPLEEVLADPPRLILSAGDSHASEDRMLSHPALGRLEGTARARLDPALLWCGGPTIERAAARLAEVRRGLKAQAR